MPSNNLFGMFAFGDLDGKCYDCKWRYVNGGRLIEFDGNHAVWVPGSPDDETMRHVVLGYIRGRDVGIGIGEARLQNQIKSLLHIT